MKKKILITLLLTAVVIQFFRIDPTNPESPAGQDFLGNMQPPQEIGKMLRSACYDCHSNSTVYPWYTKVQPLGWWIKGHVKNGRRQLNFSEWSLLDAEEQSHKLSESVEEIEERHMPLKSYTWLHPEAKLSNQDRERLAAWLGSL